MERNSRPAGGRWQTPHATSARGMAPWVRDLVSFSVLSLSAVFFVVDPMGVIPIFVAVTRNDSEDKRARTARRASWTAFLILTTFAVPGTLLFKVLGVTLGAFNVGGGTLLLPTANQNLRA